MFDSIFLAISMLCLIVISIKISTFRNTMNDRLEELKNEVNELKEESKKYQLYAMQIELDKLKSQNENTEV